MTWIEKIRELLDKILKANAIDFIDDFKLKSYTQVKSIFSLLMVI